MIRYKKIQISHLKTHQTSFKNFLEASVRAFKLHSHYAGYSTERKPGKLLEQILKCYMKPYGWNNVFPKSFKSLLQFNQLLRFKSQEYMVRLKTTVNRYLNLETFNKTKTGFRSLVSSAAALGLFNWDDHKITNEDISNEVSEILSMFTMERREDEASKGRIHIDIDKSRGYEDDQWKLIYNKPDLVIWRREIMLSESDLTSHIGESHGGQKNYDIYEYKVLGRINDATPIEFYTTQVDLDYRKHWDYLVLQLKLLDKHPETNTELIRWLMRFPYPLYPRLYVFVRRYCLDPEEGLLILVSRAIPECRLDIPPSKQDEGQKPPTPHDSMISSDHSQSVRVTKFKSNMVIMPYTELDKPGLIYVIQYYDINKAKIPKFAFKWMATSGLPDFIDKVHKAAHKLKLKYDETNVNQLDLIKDVDILYLKGSPGVPGRDSNEPVIENPISSPTTESEPRPTNLNEQAPLLERTWDEFFKPNEPHPVFFN